MMIKPVSPPPKGSGAGSRAAACLETDGHVLIFETEASDACGLQEAPLFVRTDHGGCFQYKIPFSF